ncbi:MAG: NUDIX hydrolase [Deltaproteobacteria bacterium]|nr:NUDIX hydrolase [Deltaproteobacteria bacterium]
MEMNRKQSAGILLYRFAGRNLFREEVGSEIDGEMIELTPVKQKGGKVVFAWAVHGDLDPRTIQSNTFEIEWPPGSGIKQHVPEIVKGEWFDVKTAKAKINAAQAAFIDELLDKLKFDDGEGI